MKPLPPLVKPYRDKSQKRQPLAGKKVCGSEQNNLIAETAQQFHINIPQAHKLADIAPPFPSTEKVKGKYR